MTAFSGNGFKKNSINADTQAMLEIAKREGIETVWDRLAKQQPQCGYCNLGTSCRICAMGPCRVDPFGDGPQKGVCGADADIIVARNLARMIAGGASAHSDHGRDILETLHHVGQGQTDVYKVSDSEKLKRLAAEYGIATDGKDDQKIAKELAWEIMEDYGMRRDRLPLGKRAPQARQDLWEKTGVYPRGIDRENVELMHRTHMGVDNDWVNILLHGVRTSLSDGWGGSMVATELSDTLFGTPKPKTSTINLGTLKTDQVNIILHGHNPMLSEVIVVASQDPELLNLAKKNGAKGINLAGVCCTGNEVLMRKGVPMAGNHLMQELVIMTGAVEAMVVDYQCIMPAVTETAKCYHTKVISTFDKAKFPGAEHISFDPARALEIGGELSQPGAGAGLYPSRTSPDDDRLLHRGYPGRVRRHAATADRRHRQGPDPWRGRRRGLQQPQDQARPGAHRTDQAPDRKRHLGGSHRLYFRSRRQSWLDGS
jgi:carbon-monoxide dehydrogenase catalytic subunit